jgi:hypothetical protein
MKLRVAQALSADQGCLTPGQEAFLRQAIESGRFHRAEDAHSIRRFPGRRVALKGSVGV